MAGLNLRHALRWMLTVLLGVIPSSIGWSWAFNHFALLSFVINGVVFGAFVVGLRWVIRLGLRKSTSARIQAGLFAAIAGGWPAAFITWPMLAINHPNAYLMVCSAALGFLGYRVAQGVRRTVTDLRVNFA